MKDRAPEMQGKAAEFARILREHLPELREKYGVEYLGIFGSYVRGDEQDDSDLDVLVEINRRMGLFGFIEMEGYPVASARRQGRPGDEARAQAPDR